jgi:hypothetical protein
MTGPPARPESFRIEGTVQVSCDLNAFRKPSFHARVEFLGRLSKSKLVQSGYYQKPECDHACAKDADCLPSGTRR